jgi:hypothetical protein
MHVLVLNSVTSTPQWIRQPKAAWVCVWCLCLRVSMCSDILGSLSLRTPGIPPPAPWLSHFAVCLPDLPQTTP